MAEYRVGVTGKLAEEQVETLSKVGIRLDDRIGPTTYAGYNLLAPAVTYVVVDADDEDDARHKVAEPLDVDPGDLVSARPR